MRNPHYMEDEMPDEPKPCPDEGRDPRDPNYDPRHDIYCYGELPDGTRGYKCRKCNLDYIE